MTDVRDIPKSECACEHCRMCCDHRPGWFLPGEPERAAELLGMTLPEFFKAHLAVDWLEDDGEEGEDTFLLAPVLADAESGTEYPGNPKGQCSLYRDGKCLIHEAKPHECAIAHHDQTSQLEAARRHRVIGQEWRAHQQQIRDLLGREPESSTYHGGPFGGMLGFLMGHQ